MRKRGADLGEVERTGARVHEPDPDQEQERADHVDDGEVERALERRLLLDPVADERHRRDAHQLEQDEHVEQVAGEAEADHPCHERQHQHVVAGCRHADEARAVDEREHHQQAHERGEPGPDRTDLEGDADRHSGARVPPTKPVDAVAAPDVDEQQNRHHERRRGSEDREDVGHDPAQHGVTDAEHGRDEQRDSDRQGGELAQSRMRTIASGSMLPKRLLAWTTRPRSSATTVASTTTSVRVSACTIGSTTSVLVEMPW